MKSENVLSGVRYRLKKTWKSDLSEVKNQEEMWNIILLYIEDLEDICSCLCVNKDFRNSIRKITRLRSKTLKEVSFPWLQEFPYLVEFFNIFVKVQEFDKSLLRFRVGHFHFSGSKDDFNTFSEKMKLNQVGLDVRISSPEISRAAIFQNNQMTLIYSVLSKTAQGKVRHVKSYENKYETINMVLAQQYVMKELYKKLLRSLDFGLVDPIHPRSDNNPPLSFWINKLVDYGCIKEEFHRKIFFIYFSYQKIGPSNFQFKFIDLLQKEIPDLLQENLDLTNFKSRILKWGTVKLENISLIEATSIYENSRLIMSEEINRAYRKINTCFAIWNVILLNPRHIYNTQGELVFY